MKNAGNSTKSARPKRSRGLVDFLNPKLSPKTRQDYSRYVSEYQSFLSERGAREPLDAARLHEFLTKTSRAPKTYNTKLAAIKSWLLWRARRRGTMAEARAAVILNRVPSRKIDEAKTARDRHTAEEINRLLEKLPRRWAIMVEFLHWTGCRRAEMIGIRLDDVREIAHGVAIRVIGKGSKVRVVYLPRRVYSRIRETFQGDEYLFESKYGRPFSPKTITGAISKYSRVRAGIKSSPHRFRHTRASELVGRMSPRQLAKYLGHADVRTTLEFSSTMTSRT